MSIVLDTLHKRYEGQAVVDQVSLEVTQGELFVLLGTSGSGKSTILRMIAGLVRPDGGRVLLDDRDVTNWPPQRRGTGFVFQNYSIFRHMSVAQNIEFGLRIRGVPPAERTMRRGSLLDLVGMGGLGARFADQLSGGQQQRVALARALAYEPSVLLLDEPFGALDVKTRAQLRTALKEVQRALGVTAILVTHDQDEAFQLADRIGVLDRGRLVEVGLPEALYARPRTSFAATFVGAGTVLVGQVREGRARFGPLDLELPAHTTHEEGGAVQVLFRPEHVLLSADRPGPEAPVLGKGAAVQQSFAGPLRRVRVRLPRLPATRQVAPVPPFGEEGLLVEATVASDAVLAAGDLWVSLRCWHLLDRPEPRILVVHGGEDLGRVLAIADWIAERFEATMTLIGPAVRPELQRLRRSDGRRRWEVRAGTGEPIAQALAEMREHAYDFVVLASGWPAGVRAAADGADVPVRTRLRLRRIGSMVAAVLDNSLVPVVVVRGERGGVRRMLVCTAAGEPGKQDVRVGARLARRFGAVVTLLHVDRPAEPTSDAARRHLEQAVATMRAHDVSVEVRARSSRSPAHGILEEARAGDHDVIVMGGSLPGDDRASSPDVTLQVLLGADRPVMVVPFEKS